jgi:hypothetical protein
MLSVLTSHRYIWTTESILQGIKPDLYSVCVPEIDGMITIVWTPSGGRNEKTVELTKLAAKFENTLQRRHSRNARSIGHLKRKIILRPKQSVAIK